MSILIVTFIGKDDILLAPNPLLPFLCSIDRLSVVMSGLSPIAQAKSKVFR